jgi:hypothetical protein
MAKIEIDIMEYQGMKNKIRDLESALNSVSKEAAVHKETFEQGKALVIDLKNEGFFSRLFGWKNIVEPFEKLFLKNGEIQKTPEK